MAFSEDYLEMMDNAQDAIRALLAESAEESWIGLRTGLREIRQAIGSEETRDEIKRLREEAHEIHERIGRRREEADKHRDAQASTVDDEWLEHRRNKSWWRQRPKAFRESVILDVLGDERLSLGEIADRINARFGWSTSVVYDSHIRALANEMRQAGRDLDRTVEPKQPGSTRTVQRYFCKRDLTGPIVDLERTFHDAAEAA